MLLTIRLFAAVRERAGTDLLQLTLPAGATVGSVRVALSERFPEIQRLLEASRIAVNHDFAPDTHVLAETDELAVIPPVSGG